MLKPSLLFGAVVGCIVFIYTGYPCMSNAIDKYMSVSVELANLLICFIFFALCFYLLNVLNGYFFKQDFDALNINEEELGLMQASQLKRTSINNKALIGHFLILAGALLCSYGLSKGIILPFVFAAMLLICGSDYLQKQKIYQCIQTRIDKIGRPSSQAVAAAKKRINERRENDAYIDARVAASEILRQIQTSLKEKEGSIQMVSVLSALGALAGYACQRSLLATVVDMPNIDDMGIMVVNTHDGSSYFDGRPLNYFLTESSHSIWELALANISQQEKLPDLAPIFENMSQTMGTEQFGFPNLPPEQQAPFLPIEYVKMMWPNTYPLMRLLCQTPHEWIAAFGFAIQKVVDEYEKDLELELALKIVMEAAIPMSRVNLFEYFSGK